MVCESSTDLLLKLRTIMKGCKYYPETLNAYLVPGTDSHNSEYLAPQDKRRQFLSKFTGSAGSIVITHDNACLWTDGRYYLQATQEIDSNWTLMKDELATTPTQATWLIKNLPPHSNVGIDPNVISYNVWKNLQQELEVHQHKLVAVDTNLVDLIWNDRPLPSKSPIIPLELAYSGKTVGEKVRNIRVQMQNNNVSILVLSALDEIAWVLNLRGNDVFYSPVFFSYLLILPDSVIVLIDLNKVSDEIKEHFRREANGLNLKIESYNSVLNVLNTAIKSFPSGLVWLSNHVNYSLTSIIPQQRLKTDVTPAALMKLIKNDVEIEGMKKAHLKDGVAVCCYFSWLENAVKTEAVTEISASNKLEEFRKKQADYMYPSFPTISSVDAHGAIIHYSPDVNSDIPITPDCLHLCDSGAQYKDGTTDVTRIFYFGIPPEYLKECYTRVLKGQLKLGRAVFPSKIKGNCLDSFAREFLWEVGLDYGHGTGHGVGAYLNVHEGPVAISFKLFPDDPGLEAGMFLSNEPGYYEDGKFGIRIEDLVLVVPYQAQHNFNNRGYLTFETVTFVPKQIKLIKTEMLTEIEIHQLNSYHQKCREKLGPFLEQQGLHEVKQWLWKETEPITK
ncbi:hypothetical protein FQA39_LY15366 [Lamprigera yunnana]|nr:hypothetical protein FQA39_LY15366 [Lamprigera yunnana]